MGHPVLLLGFNRPLETAKVIDAIKKAEISHLFVWLDGPRPNNKLDIERCASVRNLVETANFAAPITTQYSQANRGCRESVSQGISWFFDQVPAGIILEDDCQPSPDFFPFMSAMLEKYRNDSLVMSISGHMRFEKWAKCSNSYHFSKYPNIWGWASWSRVWDQYDVDIKAWRQLRGTDWLKNSVGLSADAERYWKYKFDTVWRGDKDTWDYQLIFLAFMTGARNVMPHTNLISNIGFGGQATHTREKKPPWLVSHHQALGEIIHPQDMGIDEVGDRETELKIYRTKRSPFELLKLMARFLLARLRA